MQTDTIKDTINTGVRAAFMGGAGAVKVIVSSISL